MNLFYSRFFFSSLLNEIAVTNRFYFLSYTKCFKVTKKQDKMVG